VKKLTNIRQAKLHGIIPPLITPLAGQDKLDHAGLERLLEHVLGGAVHGVFILGTTGEGPALSYRLRRELIERVCRQVRQRVPVLVGITDTSLVEAVDLARYAADCGAAAAVASAPYYAPPGQDELVGYIKRLVAELPLPLFLYNIPKMTKVIFEPRTIRRLADLSNIVGVKDSSGDMKYFRELVKLKRLRPDWSIFVGLEHQLTEAVRAGGDGGVNAGANYYPHLFVELYEATQSRDTAREKKLQQQLLQLGKIYRIGNSAAGVVQGLKCACARAGICQEFLAAPFAPYGAAERRKVNGILQKLNRRSMK
jgi:4-hydroxy-tetrahydrodipicolinate synthase